MANYSVGVTTSTGNGTFSTGGYTVTPNNPNDPPFPSSPINDTLQPDGSYNKADTTANVSIDGTLQLQSLFIGSAIEVDLGLNITGSSLSGTGNITGSNDATVNLPAFVNYGLLDINGTIAVALGNNAQINVSAGERLDLEGDLNAFGAGASTINVAAGAELDVNSQTIARLGTLSSQGTLKITAPSTYITGTTTLAGTVTVQGDALNGVGSGMAVARSTGSTYLATLDLRGATFAAPISSLTLLQDAAIHFDVGTTTVQQLTVAGSATAMTPLDVITVDGTLSVTGNGSGTAAQVAIAQAEFTGGTVDFMVATTDGGASLQNQITIDASTTLRNDAKMTIGGTGTTTSTIGASAAAAGSSFVNGTNGQLTIAAGAALSVAALQNAGAITVAGNAAFLQTLANTGTIDVTSGTLALKSTVSGAGTITVENGAILAIDAPTSQGIVALHAGGELRLSNPSTFAATLQAPTAGSEIDLTGSIVTAATVSNGAIMVSTTTGSFNLAETGLINGSTVAIGTDGTGGSLLLINASNTTQTTPTSPVTTPTSPVTTPTAASQPVYRFFDGVHGTQFLTSSLSETQMLQQTRPDLVYEGIGLTADNPTTDPAASPVYRFFDTRFGTHFYTSSTTERDDVISARPDLTFEGIGFYEHNTQQAGDVPVYRFFDSNFGTHFYTASSTERASILATRPDLISEGIGFYAPSNATVTS